MAELELFSIGLIVVGVALTMKVVRDGLHEINEVKLAILDCRVLTAECEANTIRIQGEVSEEEKEVQALRKEVQELEGKGKELTSTIKVKKEAEGKKTTTRFKVDLG